MKKVAFPLLTLAIVLLPSATPRAEQSNGTSSGDVVLKPTIHPRLPAETSAFWLGPTTPIVSAPPTSSGQARAGKPDALADFVKGVQLEVDSNFAKALPIFSQPQLYQGTLGHYALYYRGIAELGLGRSAAAKRTFQELASKPPIGFLVEAAALREADADVAMGDHNAALEIYERLSKTKTTAPDEVLMRMGKAAKAAGNREKAADAYSRLVYEFPFSDLAAIAAVEIESLPVPSVAPGNTRYKLELGRAERLFGSKRYQVARPIFETLRRSVAAEDRELVDLRLAECDYYLKRARSAREGVKPYIEKASRQGEALFFYAVASRDLGDHAEYLRTVERLVKDFADQSWAEEALNNLATHYILQDDDEQADAVFREMYEKFPTGHYAERAAWKSGWFAYTHGRYADTVRTFESAAAYFARSDYRPAWLYWSGRAHDALKESALADARYSLVTTDYLNSYYGRLAVARLDGRVAERRAAADVQPASLVSQDDGGAPSPAMPPNEATVRALLGLELYDQALDELRYAQRVWSDSPAIQATIGYIHNRKGALRAGINAMKRAYPQYLAAGGDKIPITLQKVLFPVEYWPLIKQYSAERQLDPYMLAALVAQESNFEADVRSSANAYGLMQLLPSTGRAYARSLHLPRRFSISMLKTADTNLKMGTAYFADLVRQFGGVHYALATYNAGPNRVSRWISQRPGIDQDEFIDDIPFPETQNYVKRILGTAEDYRRLYGPGAPTVDDGETKRVDRPAKAPAKKAAAPPRRPTPKNKPASSRPAKKSAA